MKGCAEKLRKMRENSVKTIFLSKRHDGEKFRASNINPTPALKFANWTPWRAFATFFLTERTASFEAEIWGIWLTGKSWTWGAFVPNVKPISWDVKFICKS